jgi:hypothetical protein
MAPNCAGGRDNGKGEFMMPLPGQGRDAKANEKSAELLKSDADVLMLFCSQSE